MQRIHRLLPLGATSWRLSLTRWLGRRARTRIGAAAWLSVAPLLADITALAHQGNAGLTGVIGHWTPEVDGGPAITVDGTKWNGQTPALALARAGERLFGQSSEAFVANGSAAGAFPLAVAFDVPGFEAGTLRVQFKLVAGASDQTAGVVFDLRANGEYLYVRYNTKDGDLALWKYAGGERHRIVHGTGTSQLSLGTWHELVVTVRGRELSAAVTGDPAIRLTHQLDAVPQGRVGLWTKRDAVTSFRGFRSEHAAPR